MISLDVKDLRGHVKSSLHISKVKDKSSQLSIMAFTNQLL